MPIAAHPYDDHGAMAVLSRLDPNDLIEAQLIRGAQASHLELFADWRAMQGARLLSLVLHDVRRGCPFAVLGLAHTGQSGVAQAAMLSRDHKLYRRPLIEAALQIRNRMPQFCQDNGIHRIEARSWAMHPTAGRFLSACGFRHEIEMAGFGRDGRVPFNQFAWIKPTDRRP